MQDAPHTPTIEFDKSAAPRFKSVPLQYPLKVDGKSLKSITVKRVTGAVVKTLQNTIGDGGFALDRLAEYFIDQPIAVLDALDQDDYATVLETIVDFLPARLREAMVDAQEQMEAMLQAQQAAEQSRLADPSSQTSQAPSDGAETSS